MKKRRKSRGQTLVEFALILPVLLVFFFGIIDMSFYVYAWSSVQFAARRGAEEAALRQPREIKLPEDYRTDIAYYNSDPCLQSILLKAQKNGALNGSLTINQTDMHLSFHTGTLDGTPNLAVDAKRVGKVVQLSIQKSVAPLTPLLDMIGIAHTFDFNAVSRRTIQGNGSPYPDIQPWPGGGTANFNTCTLQP